jgi:hypothetical protein
MFFVSDSCENLVAEAVDSSGTPKKRNRLRKKPLQSNGSEDVTVDTCGCLCVILTCKM